MLAPKGNSLSMVAMCDEDGDKMIKSGVDYSTQPLVLGSVKADKTGLKLLMELASQSTKPVPGVSIGPPPLGDQTDGMRYDLQTMKAQFSQEELKDGVTISGTVIGECNGFMRIDATEQVEAAEEGKPLPGPVSSVNVSGGKEFSIKVPTTKIISLIAICDKDSDGMIKTGVDSMSMPVNLGKLSEDKGNLSVALAELKKNMGSPANPGIAPIKGDNSLSPAALFNEGQQPLPPMKENTKKEPDTKPGTQQEGAVPQTADDIPPQQQIKGEQNPNTIKDADE